eukprot:CAMPEP_0169170126 /NCGR_PEP_ID=MMETSP1015-20121227/61974_1 /TAXON_ID=342587 /ORGANISM="Karlodinium micrum, Strain CCMP2283" /LENGTH=40 /DNA_ID= /DNA_START= /DNA_END= /DNA_ORIENTATION=
MIGSKLPESPLALMDLLRLYVQLTTLVFGVWSAGQHQKNS